jgi:hypothetical protein
MHRHLSNIDCLMAHTACLVCFISNVNGRSKKKKLTLGRQAVAGSGHITNLKQSILETFDIYDLMRYSSLVYAQSRRKNLDVYCYHRIGMNSPVGLTHSIQK